MNIYNSVLLLLAGAGLLMWGADRFVTGASSLAKNLGVSTLVIGILLVGFATSFPEMLLSAVASMHGNAALAIGSALGSNIINISLVLGITAIITPLYIHSQYLRREVPLLFVILLFSFLLVVDGDLTRTDGLILLLAQFVLFYWMFRMALKSRRSKDPIAVEASVHPLKKMSSCVAGAWLIFGLIVLLVSSKMMITGAVNIAHYFGMSELVIGLTIVAAGTSLPELAASLVAALRKEYDIAVGNVLGSNMFNLLGVLAMPGLFAPGKISHQLLVRDFPSVLIFTTLLLLTAFRFHNKESHLGRLQGSILVFGFVIYTLYLYFS